MTTTKTDLKTKTLAIIANRDDYRCTRIDYYTFKDRSNDLWLGVDNATKKQIQREIAILDRRQTMTKRDADKALIIYRRIRENVNAYYADAIDYNTFHQRARGCCAAFVDPKCWPPR